MSQRQTVTTVTVVIMADESKSGGVDGGARLIVVVGATGNQGRAVIAALRAAGGWRIRGITRDPAGKEAKALVASGVEVFKGDLADAPSLDAAMRGAYGVYIVSNFWLKGVGRDGVPKQARGLAADAFLVSIRVLLCDRSTQPAVWSRACPI